jgi:hypothetical protein
VRLRSPVAAHPDDVPLGADLVLGVEELRQSPIVMR